MGAINYPSEKDVIDRIRDKLERHKDTIPKKDADKIDDHVQKGELVRTLELLRKVIIRESEAKINKCADQKDIDTDEDGISDIDECMAGLNPLSHDSDGDGYPDGIEITLKTDAKDKYSHPTERVEPDIENIEPVASSRPSETGVVPLERRDS